MNLNTMPWVTIIILNWNGWKDTTKCLKTLFDIYYKNYDILVVDNNSEDESVNNIINWLEKFSKKEKQTSVRAPVILESKSKDMLNRKITEKSIEVLLNNKNYGYAEGNNKAVDYVLHRNNKTKLVLILNNDVTVTKDFLLNLVETWLNTEQCGGVYPNVIQHGEINKELLVNLYTGGNSPNGVSTVTGCCLLLSTKCIKKLGLFDIEYANYWEDTDLGVRLSKAGYQNRYCSQAKIYHKLSASFGRQSFRKNYFLYRNRFIFISKNSSRFEKFVFLGWSTLYFIPVKLLTSLYHGFQFKSKEIFRGVSLGMLDGFRYFIINF